MGMVHPRTLLEYPEDEPEVVPESLPVGPLKARRRGGVGIRELTVIPIAEAGSNASTTPTSVPGKRKSNLNSLSLPLSAVVGPLSGRDTSFLSPQIRNRRVRPSIMLHRKSSRYETAHRALLHRSGNLRQETSPEDLKIRTLEHATAFLHERIQETQEYAEQLRRHLADRDTHFVEHQCYQREKWRTDRRLATLGVLMDSAQAQYRTNPKELQDETTSLSARKQANLTSFFQRASRKAPLRFNCAVTGKALEKRVLKQVSPLLLNPSTPSTRTSYLWAPSNLPPLYARRKQPEKMISTASIREERWAPSSSCYSTEDTSASGLSPRTLSDDNIGTTHDGIALILSPALRPAEEIIAEMGDITLPAYALNLLEDFDYVHDKVPPHPESSTLDGSSSLLFVTPLDWEYPPRDPSFVSPRRTATVRIPDRRLADALLSSPETERGPRKRGHAHKVSLDPAFFKDDSRSEKLGEAAPMRHSAHITTEEGRTPMGLLKRKSSAMFSIVSKTPEKRGETAPSTPRKNIASLVKRRMPSINRFR